MSNQYDAIIIGAGIIGAATAFELAKLGYRTLNVDRLPAAGYGPTSASCAIIRVHYSTYDGTALAWEGYHYWHDWASYLEADDERGLAAFIECGCLVMKTGLNDHLEKHIRLSRELEVPFEDWDAATIREKLPIYDTRLYGPPRLMGDDGFGEPSGGELAGGVFWPTAGYISDPQLSTHNLQRAAEAKGSEFRFGREVVEIPNDGGRVRGVRLDDGTEVASPIVVNVAGPHSAIVNRMAGAPRRHDHRDAAAAPGGRPRAGPCGLRLRLPRHGGLRQRHRLLHPPPRPATTILIGSEDPECDPREFVDPDDYVRDFTEQGTTQAHRYGQRVPTLGIPSSLRGVVDLYDASDDWIPIYDKSRVPGFYMAIGTSGNQFKNAPVAGRMMAALIDYCEQGNDHDARPLTFRLEHIGREVNVGFYSRKREINRESSFSVLG